MEENKVIVIAEGDRTAVGLRLLSPVLKILVNQRDLARSALENEEVMFRLFDRDDVPRNDHSRFVEVNAPHNRNKRRSRRK